MKSDRKHWAIVGAIAIVFVGVEIVFDDILIDSTTKEITSTAKVLIVLVLGSISALVLTGVLRRYLVSQIPEPHGEDETLHSSSRALSVLPLIRALLITFIFVISVLVVMSELGINVGPMLAGAGVLGLVLGMGAQSLLKDILAGIFYIADDAFRIGEYLEFGEMRGTVERISLRSLQIRHHRGALQTVPYGTIDSVSNLSRDWVITKMAFQLPHDTDIMKVKRIVKQISAEFMQDPDIGPTMITPLKFQGIYDIDLYGLTVRLKFTSVPGEQFYARREIYRRLKAELEANGIEFARRSVKVESSADQFAAADDEDDLQRA
ncbi:mechanosensitive ion channel family protein [Ruegeria sp. A3M17]|uniref:mechanosensitive ion channel family protein n=1 Tax=Ruegeria sp. A3M17 TaxID=2267229 RepID=UPI000DEA5FDB|nr:mechanosensitive ion channel family protein [Ruegeria sp. A3M17]